MSDKKPLSECAFLAQQAAEARAAMANAGGDLCRNAAVVLSPRMWVKEHPWTLLGIPAVGLGGLATALGFLFLRKKKSKRAGWLSRWFGREPEAAAEPVKKKVWWWVILEQAFSFAQPAIFSAVAAIISSRFGQSDTGPSGNRGQVR